MFIMELFIIFIIASIVLKPNKMHTLAINIGKLWQFGRNILNSIENEYTNQMKQQNLLHNIARAKEAENKGKHNVDTAK